MYAIFQKIQFDTSSHGCVCRGEEEGRMGELSIIRRRVRERTSVRSLLIFSFLTSSTLSFRSMLITYRRHRLGTTSTAYEISSHTFDSSQFISHHFELVVLQCDRERKKNKKIQNAPHYVVGRSSCPARTATGQVETSYCISSVINCD